MTRRRTSSRVSQLKPTAVNAILAEARQAADRKMKLISLMRGQPDLPTPSHITAKASEALAQGRTNYPNNQGEPHLRTAVAGKLEQASGIAYSPEDEVLITTGATFGIYAALTAVLEPGDEVLLPQPIYDAYQGVIALAGGVARAVPATLDHSELPQGRFTLSADQVNGRCGPRTRVLLLNTPWNPTGTVIRREELAALLAAAQSNDLLVISDEIYEAVIYDNHRHVSPASLSDDAKNRCILVNSFSKTYAMTGWRLGYCAGPADLIQAMYLVLQQSSRGPALFVQDAGTAALTGSQQFVADMRQEYARRRRQVDEALADIPGVRVLTPEAGFFAMVDVRALQTPSDDIRRRLLHEFGVVVVHGAAYGPSAEGMLRVSFASGGDNLAQGLQRLRTGLIAIGGR